MVKTLYSILLVVNTGNVINSTMTSLPDILCSFQSALREGHSDAILPPDEFHPESIWTQLFQATHDIEAHQNPENSALDHPRFGELSFKTKKSDELPTRLKALSFIIHQYTNLYFLALMTTPHPPDEEIRELLPELHSFAPELAQKIHKYYFNPLPPLIDPEKEWEKGAS